MIRNVWSILCKEILTDQETNSVSYVHCIEEGAAFVLPTLLFPISVGTLWEKDTDQDEPFMARVVFVLPSGIEKQLLQTKALTFSRQRQRLHFKLEGLPITEFGRHEVRVEIQLNGQWNINSRLPFMIRKLAKKQNSPSLGETG
jgi:hypothetical protein